MSVKGFFQARERACLRIEPAGRFPWAFESHLNQCDLVLIRESSRPETGPACEPAPRPFPSFFIDNTGWSMVVAQHGIEGRAHLELALSEQTLRVRRASRV